MKKTSILFAFYFLALPVFAQQNVVATVGDEKITLEEFNKRYEEVRIRAPGSAPSKQVFLEDLVRYKVGLQEAEKRGLKNDPIVQERMRQELYKGFIERELAPKLEKIQVTESEMKSHYKDNPELRSSHILIEIRPGANEEQRGAGRKRAQEILGEVQKSKRSFEDMVNLYSDDSMTKAIGGDLGFQTRLTLLPSVYGALAKLKVGEVSGLVETDRGYHILKLTGRRSYEDATKSLLRGAVFEEKRKDLFDDLFKKLKAKYKIQTNTSLIK